MIHARTEKLEDGTVNLSPTLAKDELKDIRKNADRGAHGDFDDGAATRAGHQHADEPSTMMTTPVNEAYS